MKSLKEVVNESGINEARKVEYRVAFVDCSMISVDILVDKSDQRQFENFLMNEQDNVFAHAFGGTVEY